LSPHSPPRRIPSCILFPNGLISPGRFLTASRLSCRSFAGSGFPSGGFPSGGFLSSRLLSDCLLTSRGLLHGVLTYSFLPGRFQFFCSLARCLLMGKLLAFDLCLSCLLTGRLLSCCKQPFGFQARRLGSRRGLLPGLRRLVWRRRLGDRRLHWLIDALLGRHAGISRFRCYAFRCDGFRSPFACPLGVGRRWLGGRLRYDELWRFGLLQSDYGRDRLRWA